MNGAARLKVLLYNPHAVFFTMPLALLAIGSELDPDVYEVIIIDARLDADAENTVLSHVHDALCLGITVLTGAPIADAVRVSQAAKRARPAIPVIWGGWHPSMFARECLLEQSVDVTVQGQGEETFAEILQRLAAGRSLEGCAWLHDPACRWPHSRQPAATARAIGVISRPRLPLDSRRALFRIQGQAPA